MRQRSPSGSAISPRSRRRYRRVVAVVPFPGAPEVFLEQIGGGEPPDFLVAALLDRADGRGEPRLRHSALRRAARLQDLGRGTATRGLDLQLAATRRCGDGHPYSPLPAGIAKQIYAQTTAAKMIAKCTVERQSIEQA